MCNTMDVFVYLAVEDDQLEEGVHEQDAVRQDAAAVQEHRLERGASKHNFHLQLKQLQNDTY